MLCVRSCLFNIALQVFGFEHQHKEAVNAKMNQIRKSGCVPS